MTIDELQLVAVMLRLTFNCKKGETFSIYMNSELIENLAKARKIINREIRLKTEDFILPKVMNNDICK